MDHCNKPALQVYLAHHGILGQKWGKRNGPPYPLGASNHSSSEKKAGWQKSLNKTKKRNGDRYRDNREGVVIKRGSIIHRISSVSDETHEGRAYATYKEKDYKGYLNRAKFSSKIDGGSQFDMTMKVTKDLVIPSEKARIDAFIKFVSTDPKAKTDIANAMSRVCVFNLPSGKQISLVSAKKKLKQYNSMSEDKMRKVGYKDFAVAMGFDKSLQEKFFAKLSEKGYNATVDDADAKVVSDTPIIVFERKDTLEIVDVKKL